MDPAHLTPQIEPSRNSADRERYPLDYLCHSYPSADINLKSVLAKIMDQYKDHLFA